MAQDGGHGLLCGTVAAAVGKVSLDFSAVQQCKGHLGKQTTEQDNGHVAVVLYALRPCSWGQHLTGHSGIHVVMQEEGQVEVIPSGLVLSKVGRCV